MKLPLRSNKYGLGEGTEVIEILDFNNQYVCEIFLQDKATIQEKKEAQANAEFIVKAINEYEKNIQKIKDFEALERLYKTDIMKLRDSHDELVEALKLAYSLLPDVVCNNSREEVSKIEHAISKAGA